MFPGKVNFFQGGFVMRRLTFAVGGAAAALVALTACGTSGTAGSAAPAAPAAPKIDTMSALVQLVSAKTATTHTAHVRFTATTSAGAITGTGQIDFAGTASKIQMDLDTPVGDMDMVLVGSTVYMKLPQGIMHTAKPWITAAPGGTDPISKALSALTSEEQQNLNPAAAIAQIKGAGTITSTSKEQLDGLPTTQYTIRVDTAKLLASKAISPQLRQTLTASGVKMPAHMDYQLWVNSDNLPVQFKVAETITTTQSATPQTIDITTNYTEWGQPVTITAPAADQVGPLPGK
jgi:hypothetical protein